MAPTTCQFAIANYRFGMQQEWQKRGRDGYLYARAHQSPVDVQQEWQKRGRNNYLCTCAHQSEIDVQQE
jgi:hypothetical protein